MRLFTGIAPAPRVLDNLARVLKRTEATAGAAVNWSPVVENLHITSKFIGQWPEERLAERGKTRLRAANFGSAFEISVARSLDFFPNPHHPHTFFAGVQAANPAETGLTELANRIDDAVRPLGIAKENRPYSPHLTLARIKREDIRALREHIAKMTNFDFVTFQVSEFHLYLSSRMPVPLPDGRGSEIPRRNRDREGAAVYTPLATYPLLAGREHPGMMGILAVVAAYLIGGIPFGLIIVKLMTGGDVREAGSGNIGATNVLRTTGPAAGVLTLVLDAAKASLAVFLADWLTGGSELWMSLAALAVLAGHAWSIWIGFKGGKAVASFIGAYVYLTPVPLLAVVLLFIFVVAWTRYLSLGSVIMAGLFPVACWMILHPGWPVLVSALGAAIVVVERHRGNIERIRAGEERVFSFQRTVH